jgi:assimilatory nitrate reductase electron transfer subunit
MVICHCNVVTDRCVREAAACGAATVDEVGRQCAAGTLCGGCRPSIAALLAAMDTYRGEEQPAA